MNYQNSKIYKIYSNIDDSICYVGSTTKERLCDRMTEHRSTYKRWKESKAKNKVTSFELFDNFGLENCIIELLDVFPCNSKDELRKKEGEFIKNLNCVNKRVAGRTNQEWTEDNKEKLHEHQKQYYSDNKEKIIENVKKYHANNKHEISEKNKEWYKENKEIINEKRKVKIYCECGSCFRKCDNVRHLKTLKHIKFLELNI